MPRGKQALWRATSWHAHSPIPLPALDSLHPNMPTSSHATPSVISCTAFCACIDDVSCGLSRKHPAGVSYTLPRRRPARCLVRLFSCAPERLLVRLKKASCIHRLSRPFAASCVPPGGVSCDLTTGAWRNARPQAPSHAWCLAHGAIFCAAPYAGILQALSGAALAGVSNDHGHRSE